MGRLLKGYDGVARTMLNPLEGSIGDVDLDEITARTVSATGNITAANLSTTGNVVFSNGSKLGSATWTLVESFTNLNNYFSGGNSAVNMSQTFSTYASTYNEFLIKLQTIGSNPYNRPTNFTTIPLNAVTANEKIEIDYAPDLASGWPSAASDAYAYVVWANLSSTGLVIHNPNTGSGDNPSTNLYIYAR